MKICRKCRNGNHHECTGRFLETEKKSFSWWRDKKVKVYNNCECTCRGIINDDTATFSEKLGPDIRETKH